MMNVNKSTTCSASGIAQQSDGKDGTRCHCVCIICIVQFKSFIFQRFGAKHKYDNISPYY